jgi:hypothetical protein
MPPAVVREEGGEQHDVPWLHYLVRGRKLGHKDTGFSIDALRKFIAVQVNKAQKELEGLLLLHPDEARGDVVPQVLLYRLHDNHSNEKKGWNFLQDQRNADQLQQGSESASGLPEVGCWSSLNKINLTLPDRNAAPMPLVASI